MLEFSDALCDKCDVCKRTENLEHFFATAYVLQKLDTLF